MELINQNLINYQTVFTSHLSKNLIPCTLQCTARLWSCSIFR